MLKAFKDLKHLTELGLLVWVILEIIYSIFYFNVDTPAPFIVELQFLVLAISFMNIRHKEQRHYYSSIAVYYVYTLVIQVLIYMGLDNRESIHIIDIAAFMGCLLALIFTVIKIR